MKTPSLRARVRPLTSKGLPLGGPTGNLCGAEYNNNQRHVEPGPSHLRSTDPGGASEGTAAPPPALSRSVIMSSRPPTRQLEEPAPPSTATQVQTQKERDEALGSTRRRESPLADLADGAAAEERSRRARGQARAPRT
ncbi:unnamed protein product [Lota lota]